MAVVAIVAVKEAAFLFAMHRIVGGVGIQNQFLRRALAEAGYAPR